MVLDGLHCVKHAVRFGAVVELLVTTDREAVVRLAGELAPDVVGTVEAAVEVPAAALAPVRGLRAGTELVGFARRPEPVAVTGPTVLLDDPRNPGNVGAVIRVAAGFGAAVRTTGTIDPWHPAVVRAAAGLHFATDVARLTTAAAGPAADADGAAEAAGDLLGPVVGFDPAGEDLREVALPDRAVLAFGAERHGLSAAVRARTDRLVAIPMRDRVSSYNLATSVAVGLYHWSLSGPGAGRSPGR